MQRLFKILLSVFLSFLLILGFSLPLNPPNGFWYQQFLPNLGGRSIVDITFLDSLTGYAVTNIVSDTSYILKTTNKGDNWVINYQAPSQIFKRIQFINQNTGFVGGTGLIKTINGGGSWSNVNTSVSIEDMSFIDSITAWYVYSGSLTGGVFYTSNGGLNWTRQLDLGPLNPQKIYMVNARMGFITADVSNASYVRRTMNGGQNWTIITSGTGEFFYDLYFADTLTGWGAFFNVRKTTNGGINWIVQELPYGGNFITVGLYQFSKISRDTIYGGGGTILTPNGVRGIIYRTTNGGSNWLFQIPDTAIHLGNYFYTDFITSKLGWEYVGSTGIHTTTGGDPIWITGIKRISNEIPKEFKLYQNYPNPFNPKTIIKYQIANNKEQNKSNVKIIIFDITGKEIIRLVNEEQTAGTYEVDFSGQDYSSGVYFYQFIVDDKRIDTKKMLLIK